MVIAERVRGEIDRERGDLNKFHRAKTTLITHTHTYIYS